MTISTNSTDSLYQDIGLRTAAPKVSSQNEEDLGQEDFLELMTAQLQNQDPFAPMESGDFLGDMAQFGTVSGIEQLQKSFEGLASSLFSNQALQASSLVGKSAMVPSGSGHMSGDDGMGTVIELPSTVADLSVTVTDSVGQVIRRQDLGIQPAGEVAYQWDGKDEKGNLMPAGTYNISANATLNGTSTAMSTLIEGRIESVSLGGGGAEMNFNLTGMGSVGFNDIKQIKE